MGMAASQARLLCITARISDVEFQAQSIQNAKLQLATQSDAAYQEYMEALDAQSLVLRMVDPSSGAQSTVTATFNNLCSSARLNPAANNGYEYALKDARGRLIVEDQVAAGYQYFKNNSNYQNGEAFALYMIYGKNGSDDVKAAGQAYLDTLNDGEKNTPAAKALVAAIEKAGYKPGEDFKIAIDGATSEWYNEEDKCYHLPKRGTVMTREQMVDMWEDFANKYPIVSIEDGMAEDDWQGWKMLI